MACGSSSLTGDRTGTSCVGSVESYLLDHQGSSSFSHLKSADIQLKLGDREKLVKIVIFFEVSKNKIWGPARV